MSLNFKKFPSQTAIAVIRGYQFLTPWMNCCRFHPSCSEYTAEAIKKHGFICGFLLGSYRIMRCQPYCKGGYDPVPEHVKFLKHKKCKDI